MVRIQTKFLLTVFVLLPTVLLTFGAVNGSHTQALSQSPAAPIAPYPDAPPCPMHDERAYHGIWDAEQGCHYNHSHGDDPHEVDDIFGTAYYDRLAGGEVSYAWQTPNENLYKHGGYVWLVRRDQPCVSDFGDGCITDFRGQFHGVGAAEGATVNFHSAWLEARVCRESNPSECGIVRVGGWQGPVDLMVDEVRALDREENENRFFLHYYNTGNRDFGTWYTGAANGLYQIVPQFEDMWNTVPPFSTAEEIIANSEWFCRDEEGMLVTAGCASNSSLIQAHVVGFTILPRFVRTVDPDGDGYADYTGYLDRYAELAPQCTAVGPECIPFELEHVPVGPVYQYRGDTREYDIYFCEGQVCEPPGPGGGAEPSGWFEFPIYGGHGHPPTTTYRHFLPVVLRGEDDPSVLPTATRTSTAVLTATPTASATATRRPTDTPVATRTVTPVPAADGALIVGHEAVAEFDQIPDEYVEAASRIAFLFRHASVGSNIDSGLDCLMNNFPPGQRPTHCDRGLAPDEVVYDEKYDRTNWDFEFHSEQNPNPGWWNKVTYFVERVNDLAPGAYDMVGYKFGYVDGTPGANIDEKFFNNDRDDNLPSVEDLEAMLAFHPDKTMVWWTMGLARAVGTADATSFNEQMRAYVREQDAVLMDLADIQSHAPDGTPCTYNGYPALCADYTQEEHGGHLNALGKQRVAKALWVLFARLAGWPGP